MERRVFLVWQQREHCLHFKCQDEFSGKGKVKFPKMEVSLKAKVLAA